VLPDCRVEFEPVEEVLATAFLPALFQEEELALPRQLLALPVKKAGLEIPNPTESADDCHEASTAVTRGPSPSPFLRARTWLLKIALSIQAPSTDDSTRPANKPPTPCSTT
jgi:hypothetical protein